MLINLKLTEINSYDEPPIVGRANNRQFWAASRRVRRPPPRHCAQLRKRSPRYPRPIRLLFDYGLSQMRWICAGELLIGLMGPFRKSLATRTLPEREDTVLRKMF
jgi:hypothetical protein